MPREMSLRAPDGIAMRIEYSNIFHLCINLYWLYMFYLFIRNNSNTSYDSNKRWIRIG